MPCDITWVLQSTFHARLLVRIDVDTGEAKPPCDPCQMQRGRHQCGNTRFKAVPDAAVHTNYQEVRIQESSKSLPMGAVPRSICVLLQDDLADCCQTGGESTAQCCCMLTYMAEQSMLTSHACLVEIHSFSAC